MSLGLPVEKKKKIEKKKDNWGYLIPFDPAIFCFCFCFFFRFCSSFIFFCFFFVFSFFGQTAGG